MRFRTRSLAWLIGPAAMFLFTAVGPDGAGAVDPVPGGQGTDTALPATPSQVTISGRDRFAGLKVTVNQTKNLTNQAVSITWTGGEPTIAGPGRFGSRYLQIFQCWGDDDGSVPGNPGPPATQCEQGAVAGNYGGLPGGLYPSGFALSRVISRSDWTNFDPTVGHLDTTTTNVWLPFRAVDGVEVAQQTDPKFNPAEQGGNFWLNPYFGQATTNEIAGAATGSDGKGAELFQVLTGVQSSGLGCGQKTQPQADGSKKIPQCWIVVVPRGTPAEENAGTPFVDSADQFGVATSPVAPAAWQHRIAIPIEFNPVDSPCSINQDSRRISGSELALSAVVSWQPVLCGGGTLPPYSYGMVGDNAARQQLLSKQAGSPGMVVVSEPFSNAAMTSTTRPVVFAPLTLSGLVIGFNIERNPLPTAQTDEQVLAGVRVANLNMSPRLVAKLLTQSYQQAVSIVAAPPYTWLTSNPAHMGLDPDFLQFNPEFRLLQIADGRTFSSLELPTGNADAMRQLWQWVLADPEAKAWLDGAPDEWGMVVNPVYATKASINSNGIAFGDPVPTAFPKSDPYCYVAPPRGPNNSIVPPALCGTDWMPYKRSYGETAQVTRAASDSAKIVENPFPLTSSDVWKADAPQYLGRRAMLAVTDAPSAALFGLQTVSLSRAGDDGSGRAFVAPTTDSFGAGLAAMSSADGTGWLVPSPLAPVPGAYPLTTLTYAAVSPADLDATARHDYAAFIDYAAGPGQTSGFDPGQLPRGFAPLPESLRTQAANAAAQIRDWAPPSATPTTNTTIPAATTTVAASEAAAPDTVAPSAVFPTGGQSTVTVRPTSRQQTSTATIPAPVDVTTTLPADSTETTVAAIDDAATTTTSVPATEVGATTTTVATEPGTTPSIGLDKSRYALSGFGSLAVCSALGALEITKRPRRHAAITPPIAPGASAPPRSE